MRSILDEITEKNKEYDNNIIKMSVLEERNDRLMAEICYDIIKSRNNILKEIEENKDYLKLLPKTAATVDGVIEYISNDELNSSNVKLIIEILLEIQKHNNYNKDENMKLSIPKRIFDKYAKKIKESLGNDN